MERLTFDSSRLFSTCICIGGTILFHLSILDYRHIPHSDMQVRCVIEGGKYTRRESLVMEDKKKKQRKTKKKKKDWDVNFTEHNEWDVAF